MENSEAKCHSSVHATPSLRYFCWTTDSTDPCSDQNYSPSKTNNTNSRNAGRQTRTINATMWVKLRQLKPHVGAEQTKLRNQGPSSKRQTSWRCPEPGPELKEASQLEVPWTACQDISQSIHTNFPNNGVNEKKPLGEPPHSLGIHCGRDTS